MCADIMFCMSMGHGRISRDAHLFLFLGYAVSVASNGARPLSVGSQGSM